MPPPPTSRSTPAGASCAHPARVDGICTACGHCAHEIILNRACYFCGSTDIDALAVSPKPMAALVPAHALVRKRPGEPGGHQD
jgi:hypothetical protein